MEVGWNWLLNIDHGLPHRRQDGLGKRIMRPLRFRIEVLDERIQEATGDKAYLILRGEPHPLWKD